MKIKTGPIRSIPGPIELINAMNTHAAGQKNDQQLETFFESAIANTVTGFEETGTPVITDGEQTKPSFATYPISGQVQAFYYYNKYQAG